MTYPAATERSELMIRCRELRDGGKSIVFTNGCFDILHAGHVTYLIDAAKLGDILIVGINSDSSVTRLKGPQRPIVPEEDRAMIIAALNCVAYTVLFQEDTPYELINDIQPDILVKGGDYDPDAISGPKYIVGSDIVRKNGGRVEVINLVAGRSTTNIVERVLQTAKDPSKKRE